jgi:general secretion pathway protein A
MTKKLLALYGLTWNPFAPERPSEALLTTPKLDSFCWRLEQSHVREGGFALITGDPGTGKRVALRVLAERLGRLREVTVGALAHPQSSVADFYRELGDLFGVALKPHNRWGGFKALRERWQAHIDTTLVRPVLLIDEGQEMSPAVLSELRSLSSTRFDSRLILSVVLAGDGRLAEALRREELLSLGSRIRTRLALEYASPEERGRRGDALLLTVEHRAAPSTSGLALELRAHDEALALHVVDRAPDPSPERGTGPTATDRIEQVLAHAARPLSLRQLRHLCRLAHGDPLRCPHDPSDQRSRPQGGRRVPPRPAVRRPRSPFPGPPPYTAWETETGSTPSRSVIAGPSKSVPTLSIRALQASPAGGPARCVGCCRTRPTSARCITTGTNRSTGIRRPLGAAAGTRAAPDVVLPQNGSP